MPAISSRGSAAFFLITSYNLGAGARWFFPGIAASRLRPDFQFRHGNGNLQRPGIGEDRGSDDAQTNAIISNC